MDIKKLSRQEKEIIATLRENGGHMDRERLSWNIAYKFDRDGTRVWNRARAKEKLCRGLDAEFAADDAEPDPEVKKLAKQLAILDGRLIVSMLMDAPDEKLTQSHMASISRSLRRLERRGLINIVRWDRSEGPKEAGFNVFIELLTDTPVPVPKI